MNKAKHLAPKPLYANWHSVCCNTEIHLWPWHNTLREGYREELSSVNRRSIEKGEREAILKLHEPSFPGIYSPAISMNWWSREASYADSACHSKRLNNFNTAGTFAGSSSAFIYEPSWSKVITRLAVLAAAMWPSNASEQARKRNITEAGGSSYALVSRWKVIIS